MAHHFGAGQGCAEAGDVGTRVGSQAHIACDQRSWDVGDGSRAQDREIRSRAKFNSALAIARAGGEAPHLVCLHGVVGQVFDTPSSAFDRDGVDRVGGQIGAGVDDGDLGQGVIGDHCRHRCAQTAGGGQSERVGAQAHGGHGLAESRFHGGVEANPCTVIDRADQVDRGRCGVQHVGGGEGPDLGDQQGIACQVGRCSADGRGERGVGGQGRRAGGGERGRARPYGIAHAAHDGGVGHAGIQSEAGAVQAGWAHVLIESGHHLGVGRS